jgi:hypothetical protein
VQGCLSVPAIGKNMMYANTSVGFAWSINQSPELDRRVYGEKVPCLITCAAGIIATGLAVTGSAATTRNWMSKWLPARVRKVRTFEGHFGLRRCHQGG